MTTQSKNSQLLQLVSEGRESRVSSDRCVSEPRKSDSSHETTDWIASFFMYLENSKNRKMDCVIDIQGFRDVNNKFIIKEAAVTFLNNHAQGHWVSTPPYPFTELPLKVQIHNNIQTHQVHGLEWFDGDVSSRHLHANLREVARNATTVWVFGAEKAKIIENITARCVVDLALFKCPIETLNPELVTRSCIQHGVQLRRGYPCALARTEFYKVWLLENYDKVTVNQDLCYSHTNSQGENSSNSAGTEQPRNNGYSTNHEGTSWFAGCVDGCISSGSDSPEVDQTCSDNSKH